MFRKRPEPEPAWEREEALAIPDAIFEIRGLAREIKTILAEEDDGSEEDEPEERAE